MVLDKLINSMKDVQEQCLEVIKPLHQVLCPLKEEQNIDDVQSLIDLFPEEFRPDVDTLKAELELFSAHVKISEKGSTSLSKMASLSESLKQAFPLTNSVYRLAETAPVTVAKDERSFSKLKAVKTLTRSSMGDERLESLVLMACERDVVANLDLKIIAKQWASLKSRRIGFPGP